VRRCRCGSTLKANVCRAGGPQRYLLLCVARHSAVPDADADAVSRGSGVPLGHPAEDEDPDVFGPPGGKPVPPWRVDVAYALRVQ
jgi:hypothetical protein